MAEDEAKAGRVQSRAQALGPIGEHVAANLVRLRAARGLSTGQLSEALAALGRPIPPSGITKIEKHVRRVDADDLVALGLVLNVSPLALLLPQEEVSEWAVARLADQVEATIRDAWRWASGDSTLPPEPGDLPDQEQQEAYERLSQSKRLRYVRSRPAGQAVELLRDRVHRAVEVSQSTSASRPDEFANRLAAARIALSRLAAELDQMELDHTDMVSSWEQQKAERARRSQEEGIDGQGLD
ncbi:helix-turn-helix domain-containing protein [Kitasatospora sp. NBC_00085]|uniref:helix-turn-helix domain-containing protein n=1 Tax=Kitasatospora sp. NBC_00085 TaxID=2903566 RepID=UPI003245BE84